MPATQRLTAYGATAKGSGYANTTAACATTTSGVALLATDNSAVFVYAESDDADTNTSGDGYANGQIVWLAAQAIGGIFGTTTTDGYYTVTIDGDADNSAYITIFAEDEVITQPTACDPFPNKESAPTGDQYTTEFVDNQMSRLTTQYNRAEGLESFVPIRMSVRGPSNLRRQSTVYKVTKG